MRVNGEPASGLIGAPFWLELTYHLERGENTLRIEPRAPRPARIVPYRVAPAHPN